MATQTPPPTPTPTQTRPAPFTYADYARLPEEVRCEIIDGELIMAAAPNILHQRIILNFVRVMEPFIIDNRWGELFIAPTDVYLSDTNVVQPDLLFVAAARSGIITEAHIRGAPDLVIEIGSPTTVERDRTVKADLYARFGVAEYWLCNPTAETVDVRRLENGRLQLVGHYTRTDWLSTPLLPGLQIDLRAVFPC